MDRLTADKQFLKSLYNFVYDKMPKKLEEGFIQFLMNVEEQLLEYSNKELDTLDEDDYNTIYLISKAYIKMNSIMKDVINKNAHKIKFMMKK